MSEQDINPVYVDGEPVCSEKCSLFAGKKIYGEWENVVRWCKVQNGCSRFSDENPYPCIPALRRDRDRLLEQVHAAEITMRWDAEHRERLRARKDDPDRVGRAAKALRGLTRLLVAPDYEGDVYKDFAKVILAAADAEEG
jgi:hypothetical protein